MSIELYFDSLLAWIALALITFLILLFFKPSTYGRHTNLKRLSISNKWGWFLMELPTLFIVVFFLLGSLDFNIITTCFIFLYVIHYVNRVFVFPFRLNTKGKKMPLLIVISAIFFNMVNVFFIGYYFGNFATGYDLNWLYSPQFISGFALFLVGAYVNNQSDSILINLRKESESGYKIPHGGLFKYVSCPNHLGEIIEWIGFAILTWSMPGLAFALWTIANLLPRAISHHIWYKKEFKDYPVSRKAIIPFLI
jgi:3-oxo-5-alpha-steroid 4-dehydrogenase 1